MRSAPKTRLALRDAQASAPDWSTIGQLLNESYVELKNGLER